MKVYEGELVEGGAGKPDAAWKRYSYLKIGTEQLNNICINIDLDKILQSQIDKGIVKLWVTRYMFRNIIIGITQANGQTHRQNINKTYGQLACLWGFFLAMSMFAPFTGKEMFFFGIIFLLGSLPSLNYILKVRTVKADHSH
ncbi:MULTISPECIES: hypothetical protein [Burkholderia cepacia complex]|uniref:hypothetical protein n=1 Tax=Burkholderia cepacia complex TaxID=87882 RepID=UPI00076D02CD|nr:MULTISPECIES: hypothetical protein [Burkholderia cepacia complex]KVE65157.1 hypothetical protein WI97_16295 [Burkholderia vietnamiensis]MDR5660680.1 hypothetical protein [Burkholderia cenocepacia]MDR8093839.1 hypothetical protein [Burkholderia cenocepacia]